MLEDLHNVSYSSSQNVPSGFVSGLTSGIIDDIVANLQYIDSVDFILNNFFIMADNIFGIIKVRFSEVYSPPPKKAIIESESEEEQFEFDDWSSNEEFNDEENL